MRKIKEVLRLKFEQGLSHRAIAQSCRIGIGTVYEYLARANTAGLSWPLPAAVGEDELARKLFPPSSPAVGAKAQRMPDWQHTSRELRRPGVTLHLLWQEYLEDNPDGYGYSQYCQLYRDFAKAIDPRMRQVHKAGEKLFVDYAGQLMPVIDRKTGEIHQAPIFVASQGASDYTYAEATWTQTLPDWTSSHVRAFEFFGGVTRIVVPDNLKTGVTSPHLYDPDLNPSYMDLAEHYGIAVVPARAAKPRDKAKAEVHVQMVERQILAPLRNRRFLSLADLNKAIAILLEKLNDRPFQKLEGTRRELFEQIDAPVLRPLPAERYIYCAWKKASVSFDYHIDVERCYYSVPFQLIKKQVDVRITARIIEIFYKGERIASHARASRVGEYVTCPEHMPPHHLAHAQWTPERFARWAREAGGATAKAVEQILERHVIPEQGFRSCMGVMRLGDRYGAERLEAACVRIMSAGYPTYKRIEAILKKGLDQASMLPASTPVIEHANIRGAGYYASKPPGTSLSGNKSGGSEQATLSFPNTER
jgi:transposase